ncbi:PepSY domain-containing protein [Nocardioides jensenii]|uniref:PepSY domain-containing protein n=1 Tax=Nocardioides jensenii TaxID=1843 RepID=UPI00082DE41F|nr:PepSY domain-containing protein [Nocardioides jensenii]
MTDNQTETTAAPATKRRWRSRRVLIPAVAAIAVVGVGGVVWASAADDDLSGSQRDRASQAAVEAAGGGSITEAEEDDGFYEVEVTRTDGTEVDVRLDQDYGVVGTETDGPDDDRYDDRDDADDRDDGRHDDRDDAGDRDADDQPLTAGENTAAEKAALAETGKGTVTDVDRDDDGGAGRYEVEVTKADGTEWSVRLDRDFAVLSSHRDD